MHVGHADDLVAGALWPRVGSVEQFLAPVLVRLQAGRTGEDTATGVLDVFAQAVMAEFALQGDELLGAADEGDAEQPGHEFAGGGVDSVGEGIAPTQDAEPVVVFGAGQSDVRVVSDDLVAVVVLGVEVRGDELAVPNLSKASHTSAHPSGDVNPM
jgi:hypothetical protein